MISSIVAFSLTHSKFESQTRIYSPYSFQKTKIIRSDTNLHSYDVVHSIDTLFATQLVGCATVIGAGTYTSTLEPESLTSSETTTNNNNNSNNDEVQKVDIYRDTPLRYAGYLNEIGEAFRPLVPGGAVILSYVLALTYVFADGISKGVDAGKLTPPEEERESIDSWYESFAGCTFAGAVDTLGFQLLASIAFPGFIINRWVTLCAYLIQDNILFNTNEILNNLPIDNSAIDTSQFIDFIPTALGLALIPLIVTPLDSLTDKILDITLRPILWDKFPRCALPFDLDEE